MKSRSKLNIRNSILGILMQGPAHGYHIKRLFVPFIARDGINDGQLYPMLAKLEEEKLVKKEVVHQQKSPSKNMYHITRQGREEFMKWLLGPDDEADPIKYDFFLQYAFLVKCIFFEHLPRRAKVAKLKRQLELMNQKIPQYQLMHLNMLERGLSAYKLQIVQFGIELQQLKIRWIQQMLALEMKEKDYKEGAASQPELAAMNPAFDWSKKLEQKG